jgi:hypothetical protein
MEVVIVIQPDDWPDDSDTGHRVFGVFRSVLAAEAAVRRAIAEKAEEEDWHGEPGYRERVTRDEFDRFAFEVMDVDQRTEAEV